MLQSHFFLMVLYAALVGLVGGVLMKETPSEQVRAGAAIAGSLVGGAVAAGWFFYVFPL
jgi:uncharacterized membrane protein